MLRDMFHKAGRALLTIPVMAGMGFQSLGFAQTVESQTKDQIAQTSGTPNKDQREQIIARVQQSFNQFLKDTGQFVFIPDVGGTDHNDLDTELPSNLLTFLATPGTMQILADHGIKFLAMEIHKKFQPLIDRLVAGEITPDQYAHNRVHMYYEAGVTDPIVNAYARGSLEARVILQAAKAGIKILCVESQEPDLKTYHETLSKLESAMRAFFNLSSSSRDGSYIRMWYETGNPQLVEKTVLEEIYREIEKSPDAQLVALNDQRLTEKRLRNDVNLAKEIKARVGTAKTAFIYGEGHAMYPCNIGEFLEAKVVTIYPNGTWFFQYMQGRYMSNVRLPESAMVLDSGDVYSRSEIESFLIKDAPRLPDKYMPHVCVPAATPQ